MLALSHVAAKSNHNELGIDQNEFQENAIDPLLSAQTIADQSRAVAHALPLLGNLRPDALLPVVVQPQLVPGTVYTPPFIGAECRGRAWPFLTRPWVLSTRSMSAMTVLHVSERRSERLSTLW